MAISPQQLNEAFLKEVKAFEERIDQNLSSRTIAKGKSISLDVPSGMTYIHFEILKTRYISAGWSDVKLESDQREGSWLSFKY
jgi:hypothetical protein